MSRRGQPFLKSGVKLSGKQGLEKFLSLLWRNFFQCLGNPKNIVLNTRPFLGVFLLSKPYLTYDVFFCSFAVLFLRISKRRCFVVSSTDCTVIAENRAIISEVLVKPPLNHLLQLSTFALSRRCGFFQLLVSLRLTVDKSAITTVIETITFENK